MPEFDVDSALDPEAAERREQQAYAEERRLHQAEQEAQRLARAERVTSRAARMDPVLQYMTRRESWDAWVWPDEIPDWLSRHILRVGVLTDLSDVLDLIKRVYALDQDQDSDIVEALCDHRNFDMDDVERDFEDSNFQIVRSEEDYGRDYAEGMERIPEWLENYIDFEQLGKDLLQDQETVDLSDGRTLVFRD